MSLLLRFTKKHDYAKFSKVDKLEICVAEKLSANAERASSRRTRTWSRSPSARPSPKLKSKPKPRRVQPSPRAAAPRPALSACEPRPRVKPRRALPRSRAASPPCCKPSRTRSFLYRAEPRLRQAEPDLVAWKAYCLAVRTRQVNLQDLGIKAKFGLKKPSKLAIEGLISIFGLSSRSSSYVPFHMASCRMRAGCHSRNFSTRLCGTYLARSTSQPFEIRNPRTNSRYDVASLHVLGKIGRLLVEGSSWKYKNCEDFAKYDCCITKLEKFNSEC
uniref:Uncharacterized protein n=1 Tax=Cucumis melo TaxID=3656 RepID=A0A9I9E6A9_CUCME